MARRVPRVRRVVSITVALGSFTLTALLVACSSVCAQPWVPPAGNGSITFIYQRIDNTGHLRTDGTLVPNVKTTDLGLYVEGEYAFSDRFSVTAGLPYVFAKFVGLPPRPPIPFLPVDQCYCWNSGWQDFGFTARYNIVNGAFALTPSVAIGVPSHQYEYRGEAVLGRDLREVRIAVDAGQRLDAISKKLSVQGRYSYALVEQVLDIPNNRSNASLEGAYAFTRRFSARGALSWQRTHGGLRLGSASPAALVFPGEVNTQDRLDQHDRLLRDNNFHAGAGAAYSFPALDLFASITEYVSGTDTHSGRVFTVGVSWPFELGHPHRAP